MSLTPTPIQQRAYELWLEHPDWSWRELGLALATNKGNAQQFVAKALARIHDGDASAIARATRERAERRSVRALRELDTQEFKRLLGDRAREIVASIDQGLIDSANLKDRAIAAGILTDKFLLLDGRPTQIVQVEDRRALGELFSAMLEEMKRRGITVDVTPPSQAATP